MLQPDLKDLFLNLPFRSFPLSRLFFEAIYAPSEFMSLFLRQEQADGKGEMRKILIGKKCWEAKPSSLFFPQQRQTGIFHFHLTSEICRLKKASHGLGDRLPHNRRAGEKWKRAEQNGVRNS